MRLARALRTVWLPSLLSLSSCMTASVWRDDRTKLYRELYRAESPPLVVRDEEGRNTGLALPLDADEARVLAAALPSGSADASWLVLEPLEYPESFFALSFHRRGFSGSLNIVRYLDGTPQRIELSIIDWQAYMAAVPGVRVVDRGTWGMGWDGLIIPCRLHWQDDLDRTTMPSSLRGFGVARVDVQEDDNSALEKMVITPATLVIDLAFLPLQPFLIGQWLW